MAAAVSRNTMAKFKNEQATIALDADAPIVTALSCPPQFPRGYRGLTARRFFLSRPRLTPAIASSTAQTAAVS